jgi:predicted DsbA family dithiol-disulfide isomerase
VAHVKTLKGHELLHHAKAQGVQLEMKERLLKAYFVEGGRVNRIDELVAFAEELGLDPAETREALESGRYADAVQADIAQARAYGIQGVPFFVFDGRYGVSGAQPAEVFAQVLSQVEGERDGAAA